MIEWIIGIHIALFIACAIYARVLNRPEVYGWYRPSRTYVVVIGGDVLIGFAVAALCALGIFPWLVMLLYATLHIVAGLPIIIWQFQRETARTRQLEEIERGA